MLETGKIIRRMGLEYSTIKMGINIKVDGIKIKGMDKALSGYVILRVN